VSHWIIGVAIRAERRRPATFSFAVHGDKPIETVTAFAQAMAQKVDPVLGGIITGLTVTRDVALPVGLKTVATADADADIGRKMILPLALDGDPQVVNSINSLRAQVMIPTWRRSQIDPNPYYWSSRRKRKVYGPALSSEYTALVQMLIAPHEVDPAFVFWTDDRGTGRISNIVSPRLRRY